MELTFYCVPSCDQVPIPGKGTWILVENLKKTSHSRAVKLFW